MVDDILEDSGEEAALSKDGVVMVTDKNVQPFFPQVLFFSRLKKDKCAFADLCSDSLIVLEVDLLI